MVDTGATVTAIPQAVADIAKLENCRAATFNTANGVAIGRVNDHSGAGESCPPLSSLNTRAAVVTTIFTKAIP